MTMAGRAVTPIEERLYRADGVRELDRRAIEDHGMDGYGLMVAAGTAAFGLLREHWPGTRRIAIVCGGGNNGGDGLVIGRRALAAGLAVDLVMMRAPEDLGGSAANAWADFSAAGGCLTAVEDFDPTRAEVIVDALLGTGLDRAVAGPAATVIERINRARGGSETGPRVLAIDIPSGLAADSGRVLGVAVEADATITFIGHKRGLYTGAGPAHAGRVYFDALATPAAIHQDLEPWVRRVTRQRARLLLPRRSPVAHKGDAGRVLVVGGDTGMAGAVRMAGEAALRAGAGLVAVATRRAHTVAISTARPELMTHALEDPARELPALLAAVDTCIVGPGLGRGEWGQAVMGAVVGREHRALLVDADGLNALAREPAPLPAGCVLTPHPGEAARLLGVSTAEIGGDRFAALDAMVERYAATVVLKGAGTLIGAPAMRTSLVASAQPALATGGTGDILAGVIGGLCAQGLSPAAAAEIGVWLHAAAAEETAAGREAGLLATDLLPAIGRIRGQLADG